MEWAFTLYCAAHLNLACWMLPAQESFLTYRDRAACERVGADVARRTSEDVGLPLRHRCYSVGAP